MTKRFVLTLAAILLAAVAGLIVWTGQAGRVGSSSKLRVTASFYPMAEFARQVGGDRITVNTLVGPGVEPHDYDPSPKDLTGLYKSKLFIYNGAGLESWVGRVTQELQDNNVRAVDASNHISVRPGDPHIWLDPVLASRQVATIEAALVAADPAGAAYYRDRAKAYVATLTSLDRSFRTGLEHCARRDIVPAHDAFGYVADRYRLTVHPIAGLSPEEEPSPQQLAQIAAFARQNGVKYIFFESLVSPRLAQTIADEVGAKTLVLNPIEGLTSGEQAAGENYVSIQKDNLKNLRIALDCR